MKKQKKHIMNTAVRCLLGDKYGGVYIMTKKLANLIMGIIIVVGMFFVVWGVMSWLEVVLTTTTPGGVQGDWNLFKILFS